MSSKSSDDFILYLELDALMDTRIGTLMRINPDFAIRATGSKDYHARLSDDLTDIIGKDFEQKFFKDAYYQRDISTLFYSRATRMVEYLASLIKEQAVKKMMGDPRLLGLQVIVNTFPYALEDSQSVFLRRVIATSLGIPVNHLELDYLPYREMSIGWLRSLNPTVMVIYNFNEWTSACKDMPKTIEEYKTIKGNPETILLTPGLLHTRHDYNKIMTMDRSGSNDKDPFIIAKKAFAPLFALEVLPARLFSVQRYIVEKVQMTDLNKAQQDVILMNQLAGRTQENKPNAIIAQTEQVVEEFYETITGLGKGLLEGDWEEFRNGLGDMIVVIWGEENVAEIPMADDLAKIMQKNLSKFDTDYVTATSSLHAMQEAGYKCEIRETEINGQKYFPILTTEAGFVVEGGKRKDYNKDKFLKSINWSVEEFEASPNLPMPDAVTKEDLERYAQMVDSLTSRFAALGIALRERMKSL